MKLLLCVLLPSLCAPAFAAGLTEGERGRALSELHASRKQFLDAVAGLSGAQWNFKPDGKTWSIAECAEHIALSEDAIFELVTRRMMSQPAEPEKRAQTKGRDEAVLQFLADRTQKFQSPEMFQPKQSFSSRQALSDHFKQTRERFLEYVRTTPDDLRNHFSSHPVMKLLDGYQWILTAAGHSARHAAQIEEIKANPKYPR